MADTLPPLVVEIIVHNATAIGQLKEVQGQIKKVGQASKETSGLMPPMAEQFKELGRSLVSMATAVAIFEFLKQSTKIAADNAASYALFARQVKATKGGTDALAQSLDKQIQAMNEVGAVGTGPLRQTYGMFLRATGDTTKAMKLTNLAMNVSAGTHRNMTFVTRALSMAYDGNYTALRKLAPGAEKAKNGFQYLAKQFKDAAKTAADADPYKRLEEIMHKIQVTLGTALLPIVKIFYKVLEAVLPVLNPIVNLFSKLVVPIVRLAGQIIKMLMPALNVILKLAVDLIMVALKPLMKIIVALMPVIQGIANWLQFWGEILDYVVKSGGTNNIVMEALAWIIQKLSDAFKVFIDIATKGMNLILKFLHLPEIKFSASLDTSELDASLSDLSDVTAQNIKTPKQPKGGKTDPLITYLTDTQNKILDLQKKYRDALTKANQDYANAVMSQIDDFRSAFKQATEVNAADLFNMGYRSADQFIRVLGDKVKQTQQLAADAAKLSAQGYSAEFVKQVMSQGAVVGDQMAQSLLSASPEQAAQLQELYKQANDAAATGVNDLSVQIADQFTASTKNLADAMNKAAVQLKDALAVISRGVGQHVAGKKLTSKEAKLLSGVESGIKSGEKVANQQIINVTANSTSTASPSSIARDIVSSIKFGLPITATGTTR